MALGTFIAGRYSGTFKAVDVGITRQGYELEITPKQEMIDETDAYGLSTIDWVMRGADAFLTWTSKEYKAGSLGALTSGFGSTFGLLQNAANPVGRLASAVAGAFVLTATANTPAAASPASLTASQAQLAPSYNTRLLFDSRLREVPIRQQLLPYLSSQDTVFFTTT